MLEPERPRTPPVAHLGDAPQFVGKDDRKLRAKPGRSRGNLHGMLRDTSQVRVIAYYCVAMSATETKQRLSDYHAFLALARAIVKDHSAESDEIRMALDSVPEFLGTASSRDIRERGKELEALLSRAVKIHEKVLQKKKSTREIARDFRYLTKSEPDIWRFGIQNNWLSERFDTSRLPQAKDLPRHARVGIGIHAGQVSVEEVSLLGDTFFLLVQARESFEAMMLWAHSRGLNTSLHKHAGSYRTLSALSSSVCTYSRLGVLTATAFVEAFVNSVGWNEAAGNWVSLNRKELN